MVLLSVDVVLDPYQTALYASCVLAVDKGIPNAIECVDAHTWDVVTDQGAFRFTDAP